ncbi:DUF4279 domain-containing protein [Kribbella sp. NPDC051770]|uniref:DUF4279 domain-containing protein n=1 Tax=Kribbella sp. NPDC051770 TaxID=3155413 RepID=UPI00341F9716
MRAFEVYLRVASTSLLPEEITGRVGVPADEVVAKGTQRRPHAPAYRHSVWKRRAVSTGDGRAEDFEDSILGWGLDFAEAVGSLVAAGQAEAFLVIVQRIDDLDDPLEKGIFLSPELIRWMAAARASLDIDQYVFPG